MIDVIMKFLRIGSLNCEKPAIIDNNGVIRDLSSIINDLDPQTLNLDTIGKLDINKIHRGSSKNLLMENGENYNITNNDKIVAFSIRQSIIDHVSLIIFS